MSDVASPWRTRVEGYRGEGEEQLHKPLHKPGGRATSQTEEAASVTDNILGHGGLDP